MGGGAPWHVYGSGLSVLPQIAEVPVFAALGKQRQARVRLRRGARLIDF
jgi:hypothetical protein